jgi:hypothetical protein
VDTCEYLIPDTGFCGQPAVGMVEDRPYCALHIDGMRVIAKHYTWWGRIKYRIQTLGA